MKTFVTCANCGARMRADRAWCLRCDEKLVAAAEPVVQRLSRGQQLIIATVGSLALLFIGALVWEMRPKPSVPAPARAGASAAQTGQAAADGPTAPPPADQRASGEFVDRSRAGTAAFLTGDLNAAKQQFERALEHKPDDPEALNSLGQVLDHAGDIEGAVARFERAIQLAPDKWTYHFNLAHAVGRQAQWERAATEYREAARLFPEDYATQYNLAMALHHQGKDAAAIPEFERAIQLAPSESSFHIALGNSYQRIGKLAEARKEFETYLELDPSAPDADKVKAHIQMLHEAEPVASR